LHRFILVVLLLNAHFTLFAQGNANIKAPGKISGRVIDSLSSTPIEYATITLFLQGDKKALNGATSDNSGHFTITDVKEGNYEIIFESIGYKPVTIHSFTVNKKTITLDLKTIRLAKKMQTLQSVTVTAQNDLIENKIDKIVFNAEKDLTSQGGVATDILKKIPQVSVDVDGNVELSGSSSIRFLINGKPSTAFGSSIADVLQSIPASQIKAIEVITNPGAKYDAQGLGGIINIILKQNTAKGINGNLSLSVGTRVENGSFNFNARKGNFGVNAFISGNERLSANTQTVSERLSADTMAKTNVLLSQDGGYEFIRHGLQSGFGFDWTLKKRNAFSGSISYNNFGNSGSGIINQDQTTTPVGGGAADQISSINYSASHFLFHTIDASMNYKRTFSKEDQELEISFNSSFGNNHITSESHQLMQPQDSLFFGSNSDNPGTEHENELQVDYTQPLKKDFLLGIGGKINYRDIVSRSTVQSYQPFLKDYFYDSTLSNSLTYNQKVYAVYAEMSFPVSDWFNTKLGTRYERTEINSFYSNAQQQVNTPGYNTLVPSIFFSKKLSHGQTIKLSYSKRIERPDYRDLNPFINTADPKNITSGNPYLKPEIGNRVEFSYSRDFDNIGSLMVTAFYRANNNDIQPYIVYYPSLKIGDSTYYNVSVSTNQNIGIEKNMGFNIFMNLHFTSRLEVRGNIFVFERHTINTIDPGYNSNSFNYRLNMNASYQFKHDLAAEFFGSFNSPRHEAQGRYPSFTTYSFAFRKQFWEKKGSLALTATNPFNEYVNQRTMLFGPNFTVNSLRKIPFRSIGLNFTWKFGKLKFKEEKKDNPVDTNPPTD
jgi:ferric enterobactin receptor